MPGDEALVVQAFRQWLASHGWTTRTEVAHVDILAERDGQRVYVEAKGRSTEPGTDADIAYGQLLRRMPAEDDPTARYALVIRDDPRSVRAAVRVPARGNAGVDPPT